MNETRPSKKQRELFTFVSNFIKEHGYGPSYREIMSALDYKSVSTVAVHIDGLVTRGLLRKRDNSARSLEVVTHAASSDTNSEHLKWLKHEIKRRQVVGGSESELRVLREALEVLSKEQ